MEVDLAVADQDHTDHKSCSAEINKGHVEDTSNDIIPVQLDKTTQELHDVIKSDSEVRLNGTSEKLENSHSSSDMACSNEEVSQNDKNHDDRAHEPMETESDIQCNGEVSVTEKSTVGLIDPFCSSDKNRTSIDLIIEPKQLRSSSKNNNKNKCGISEPTVNATSLLKVNQSRASKKTAEKLKDPCATASDKDKSADSLPSVKIAGNHSIKKSQKVTIVSPTDTGIEVVETRLRGKGKSFTTVVVNGEQDDNDVLVLEPGDLSSSTTSKIDKNCSLLGKPRKSMEVFTVISDLQKPDKNRIEVTVSSAKDACKSSQEKPIAVSSGVKVSLGLQLVSQAGRLQPLHMTASSVQPSNKVTVQSNGQLSQIKPVQNLPYPPLPPLVKKPSPIGTFNQALYDIGLDLVTERVYKDGFQETDKKLKENPCDQMKDRLQRIEKSLKKYQKKNEAFHFPLKRCELCGFSTESDITFGLHHMFPHATTFNEMDMRCGYCEYRTRQKQAFVFHMEAEHNVKARFERKRAFFECPMCSFEDNNKSRVIKHKERCSRTFKLKRNLAPVQGHELPHQPPPKKPAPIPMPAVRQVLPKPGAPVLPGQVQGYRQIMMPVSQAAVRGAAVQIPQSRMNVPGYLSSRIVYSQGSVLPYSAASGPGQVTGYRLVNSSATGVFQPSTQMITTRTTAPSTIPNMSTFVVCEICDGYIKDLESLQRHILWIHHIEVPNVKQPPPLKCSLCSSRFFTIKGLERHFQKIHKSNVYSSSSVPVNKSVIPAAPPVVTATPVLKSAATGSAGPVPVALFQNISNLPPSRSNTAEVTVFNRFNTKAQAVSVSTPVFPCIACNKSFYSHLFWLKHIKENHMPPCKVKLCRIDKCSKCIVECATKGIKISFAQPKNEDPVSEIVLE